MCIANVSVGLIVAIGSYFTDTLKFSFAKKGNQRKFAVQIQIQILEWLKVGK